MSEFWKRRSMAALVLALIGVLTGSVISSGCDRWPTMATTSATIQTVYITVPVEVEPSAPTPSPMPQTSSTARTDPTTTQPTTDLPKPTIFTNPIPPMPTPLTLKISNLTDQTTRQAVERRLQNAGVPAADLTVMRFLVTDFNYLMQSMLPHYTSFKSVDSLTGTIIYEREGMITKWRKERRSSDLTSRLFVWQLLHSQLSVALQDSQSFLKEDLDVLTNVSGIMLKKDDQQRFLSLFSTLKTDLTVADAGFSQAWLAELKRRDVKYPQDKLALVTLVAKDQAQGTAFVLHAGLLLEDQEGLLYLEKIRDMLPYQASIWDNRSQLRQYLVNRYLEERLATHSVLPLILINDQMLAAP